MPPRAWWAQGADAPIRAYNLPPHTLSLTRSIGESRFPSCLYGSRVCPPSHLNRPCIHVRIFTRSCVRVYKRLRSIRICASSLGQLLENSNSRFAMVTTLPVVDLSAITPAGHFISERCLGHDSKILIRRFRGTPAMSDNAESRKRKRVNDVDIGEDSTGFEIIKLLRREVTSLIEKSGVFLFILFQRKMLEAHLKIRYCSHWK